ncbi:MAG TPA: 2OG-Fe(II) oxygenase [Casimicrobiaceae bacterium]|nr:2OG-Fe(II) oxygenase [Casimicrobiaceae bacterium]
MATRTPYRSISLEPSGNPPPRAIRHPVAVIANFLPDEERQALLTEVLASEAQFQPSGTHDARADYRQSLVLNPPADLVRPIVERVRRLMPQVLPVLRVSPIVVGAVEAQITASVDGSFFGVHTDAGRDVPKRHLTYVYYFNRAPKGFTGGELRVYDDVVRNGKLARAESFQTIDPANNRIVLFWAKTMHEVMPVRVPSRAFADARFTVNGWINAA